MVVEYLAADNRDLPVIQMRAEGFVRSEADVLFHLGIDPTAVRDGSECMLARVEAGRDRKRKHALQRRCSKDECVCVQPEFVTASAARITAAAAALRQSTSSNHRQMGANAERTLAKPAPEDKKGTACWGNKQLGGDISIALECAQDETLITTDHSFDHICPALGVTHQILPGTPGP